MEQLPGEVGAEELIHRLWLKAKLERAEAAVRDGEVVSHEEVVRQAQQWFE